MKQNFGVLHALDTDAGGLASCMKDKKALMSLKTAVEECL
jgi:hypothetical protein